MCHPFSPLGARGSHGILSVLGGGGLGGGGWRLRFAALKSFSFRIFFKFIFSQKLSKYRINSLYFFYVEVSTYFYFHICSLYCNRFFTNFTFFNLFIKSSKLALKSPILFFILIVSKPFPWQPFLVSSASLPASARICWTFAVWRWECVPWPPSDDPG